MTPYFRLITSGLPLSIGLLGLSSHASSASNPSFAPLIADETNVACPEGTSFLASHRLCASETEAVGPFTQTMIDKCIKYGGGEGPCYGDRWTRQFALAIRGTTQCMPGTTYNVNLKECVSYGFAFGPFSTETVQKCVELGGSDSCSSMKIRTEFIAPSKYNGTRPYLKLTRSGNRTYDNLELLHLELFSAQNRRLGFVDTVSGQSWAQNFRKAPNSEMGSYEPLPEGLWQIEYPNAGTNGVEWASGSPGDYDTYWNAGLGPTWTGIIMQKGFETSRQAIGIHLDGNRDGAPGTAGCVGITTLGQLKTFVGWFSSAATSPRTIVVDWGLGTVPYVFSLAAGGIPFNLNPSGSTRYIPAWERIQSVEMEP